MVFRTGRLLIRQWTEQPGDLARVLDIYSRWEVARWLGANPRVLTDLAEARLAVRRWRALHAEHGGRYGCWAVVANGSGPDGVPAGSVLFKPLPNGAGEVEVGWHLHPDSWGRGYATESARGVVERGFAGGLSSVYAVVRPDNVASLAVCHRLGMTPLGITERWYGVPVQAFRLDAPAIGGEAATPDRSPAATPDRPPATGRGAAPDRISGTMAG